MRRRYGFLEGLWSELRVHQWAKNLLVLAPLLFSQSVLIPESAVKALGAFGLFCLVSSSIYLLNDILDIKQDRLHPKKKLRPIAAGELTVGAGWAAAAVLFLLGIGGGWRLSPALAAVLLVYWAIHLAYSLVLKHRVLLDLFAIAAGFVLRVVGGAVAIEVKISHWVLICTTLLALFLGFSKRRHELMLLQGEARIHREVLNEYSPHFLDMMIAIVTASTLMSYALYTVAEETVAKFHTQRLLFTIPFVLYGLFRYLYLIYQKGEGGDPIQSLLTDMPTVVNLLFWVASVGVILYVR